MAGSCLQGTQMAVALQTAFLCNKNTHYKRTFQIESVDNLRENGFLYVIMSITNTEAFFYNGATKLSDADGYTGY